MKIEPRRLMAHALRYRTSMRRIALLLIAASAFGCQSKKPHTATATTSSPVLVEAYDDALAASALVFDPPIAANEADLDLARDTRQPSAFVGYDQLQTTFYSTVTEDRQGLTRFGTGDW